MRQRIPGRDGERPADELDPLVGIAGLAGEGAEVVQGTRMPWLKRENLPIGLTCGIEAAGLMMRQRACERLHQGRFAGP